MPAPKGKRTSFNFSKKYLTTMWSNGICPYCNNSRPEKVSIEVDKLNRKHYSCLSCGCSNTLTVGEK